MEPRGAPSAGLESQDLIHIKSHDIGEEEEERCILYQLRKRTNTNSEDVIRRMCP